MTSFYRLLLFGAAAAKVYRFLSFPISFEFQQHLYNTSPKTSLWTTVYGENRIMIVGLLSKLYHNVIDRRTDRLDDTYYRA